MPGKITERRVTGVRLSIERMTSTIPDDFVSFIVPVIQEFDGVVEQVRYVRLLLFFFFGKLFIFQLRRHRQLALGNCLTAMNDGNILSRVS